MDSLVLEPSGGALAAALDDLTDAEQAILLQMIEAAKYNSRGDREEFDRISMVANFLKTVPGVVDVTELAGPMSIRAENVPPMIKDYAGAPTIPLPVQLLPIAAGFADVLERRCSQRDFLRVPLTLAEVATVLQLGYGIKDWLRAYGFRKFPMRRTASAGGLQSVEIYVVAFDVDGVDPGVYYFDAAAGALMQIDRGLMRRRVHQVCLSLQEWIAEAGAVLFLTCNVEKLAWKYGKKAYRMAYLDAGVAADHLHLVATALGLGSCMVSGMFDSEAERLLGIDGRREFPALAIGLGHIETSRTAAKVGAA